MSLIEHLMTRQRSSQLCCKQSWEGSRLHPTWAWGALAYAVGRIVDPRRTLLRRPSWKCEQPFGKGTEPRVLE